MYYTYQFQLQMLSQQDQVELRIFYYLRDYYQSMVAFCINSLVLVQRYQIMSPLKGSRARINRLNSIFCSKVPLQSDRNRSAIIRPRVLHIYSSFRG
jgi:hypothetical protein